MSSIFLSHNRADKPFVRRLAQDLQAAGVRVWLDEAELNIGDSLIEKLPQGINAMAFFAVVLSKSSVQSRWVQEELSMAMSQQIGTGQAKVLPLVLDDCDVPGFLQDKVYADFRVPERYQEELAKVLRALGRSSQPGRLATPSQPSTTTTTGERGGKTSGPSAGAIKLEICQRLVDDWPDLADYLQIPPATRARFTPGREPQGIWEWLEARKQLPRLRDALAHIGRDDLVEVLQNPR